MTSHTPLFDSKFLRTVHELEDNGDAQALIEMYHEVQSPQDKQYISEALQVVMDKTPLELVGILNNDGK